jgi:hypothetical protein
VVQVKLAELFEAAAGKELQFEPVPDVQKAIDLLNAHCKNALWMLHDDAPIWRGFSNPPNLMFQTIDTSKSERRSENTSNYYTAILDNNPKMAKYPKRSRSLICSMDRHDANAFASGNLGAFAIIPFDDAKIGAVNEADMWNVQVSIFGLTESISNINEVFDGWGIEDDIRSLEEFGENLRAGDVKPSLKYGTATLKITYDVKENFMDELYDAYSPHKLGFSLHTTSNLQGIEGEVWVGGRVMMIHPDMWTKLVATYKSLVKKGAK